MIVGVAFDLDGTLIDNADALSVALSKAIGEFGYRAEPDEIRKYLGLSFYDIVSKFIKNPDRVLLEKIKETRKKYIIESISSFRIFPDALYALKALKELGVKSAVATSLGKDLVDFVIKNLKLDSYLCCWVTVDEVKKPKPEPHVFLKAMELMQVKPESCIAVGDREYDVLAGKKAGSLTALVLRDSFSVYEKIKPDYILKSLEELPEIIQPPRSPEKR
jgi:HAD superfamily hydrolase (TIGR01549 family)